jgi:protocatechuate 3,4-dioxygenase, alpha subunit
VNAPTPSQTVGPFFSLGLCTRPTASLGSVPLAGRVVDGAGAPLPDAMVEIWHPDLGWARCGTDDEGRYAFTVERVPYLNVQVFARGLLKQVFTRIYFADDDGDELLAALPAEDRATLVAEPHADGFRFDINLQGDRQTAFFAV